MYQGKFNNRPSRKRRHGKRSVALLVSLILLLSLTVGGTAAYLASRSVSVTNTFIPGEVTTYVDEEISDGAKTSVKIENTGNTDAWIRVAVVVNWKNEDGYVYGLSPIEGTDYTFKLGANWIAGNDGFYYWNAPVAPDQKTGNLLNEDLTVTANSANNVKANAAGYYLNVEILGSGIQSKPASTFNSVWGAHAGITADANSTALTKG